LGTFAGIETVLNDLKPRAEFDMLCLYISTHGHLDTKTKKTYVVPSDAKYKKASKTKTVIDLSSLISSQQLLDSLTTVRSKRYLVILDICHAGGFGRLKPTSDSTVPVTHKALFGYAQGTVVLAAATIDEDASLDEDGSTFTNFIIQSIDNCSSDNNIFLLPFVENLHKSMQGNAQTPILKCDNVSNIHLWCIGTVKQPMTITTSTTTTTTAIIDGPLPPSSSTPSSSTTTSSAIPTKGKKRKRQASDSDIKSDKKPRTSTDTTCSKCGKSNLVVKTSRTERNPGMRFKSCQDCDAFNGWAPYTEEDLKSKKKKELKLICKDLGLTVSGSCEHLWNKIKTHYANKMQ